MHVYFHISLIIIAINSSYSLTTAPVSSQGELALGVALRWRNLDIIKCLAKECKANVNGES